jgi:phosphohistidine phosphatase
MREAVTLASEPGKYRLYLLRHGIAEPRKANGASEDADRKLTDEGRSKLAKAAKGLDRLGAEFDWIVTSPLARALETAQIVAATMKSPAHVECCAALRPGEPAEKLLAYLKKKPEMRNVLLVGHEPDLSLLAADWVGADAGANFEMKKGGCCLIECDRLPEHTPGRLVWWLPPRVLRALA